MTEENNTMTMEQAQQEMKEYRKVFDVVRLIGEESIRKMNEGRESEIPSGAVACYTFWKKSERCKNCITARVFREKGQRTKLEFRGEQIYQVTARYVEIDGKPYVMELVKEMEEEFLLDGEGCEKLVRKLDGYNRELYMDVLTGSYNRRYYEERLKEKTGSAGVAVIDLDDFKLWNDTYGHGAGDVALQTVGKSIRKSIRKTDSLVRYGGDEFILFMPEVTEDVFLKKLEYIQKQIRDADIPGFSRMRLSVSIGGVTVRDEVMEHAVRKADRLMYQAKLQKNMVVTERKSIDADGIVRLEEENKRAKQLIMIVDDSEMNRDILASILEEDFQIIEAENGEVCLNLLKKYGVEISLILLDIVMPGMNGFQVLHDMNKNHWIMVSILSQIVEFRNGESGLHVEHINKLTGMLLERLVQKTDKYHLTWEDQYLITVASALHDIGKIGINEEILNKQGKMTPEEFELMKMHTMIGASMLERLEIYKEERLVQSAYEICRWHHERYDGGGYPDGLKGEEIPIAAQVVSIVDVYDALTSQRVYKEAYSHEKAMQMILTGECGAFQPLLLECLCDIQEEAQRVTEAKSEKDGKISGFELTSLEETLKNSHLIGGLKSEKNH